MFQRLTCKSRLNISIIITFSVFNYWKHTYVHNKRIVYTCARPVGILCILESLRYLGRTYIAAYQNSKYVHYSYPRPKKIILAFKTYIYLTILFHLLVQKPLLLRWPNSFSGRWPSLMTQLVAMLANHSM